MDDLAQHHNDGEECPQKVPDDTSLLMSSNKQTGIMMTLWKCSLAREWTDTVSWQQDGDGTGLKLKVQTLMTMVP